MSLLFQRVPEAELPTAVFEEALAFHGLTREKMSAEIIRWIGSVKLESPKIYLRITYDPPEISGRIERYDFVFSTGVTIDAPKRRGWTNWMAVREFIQNMLDIEERIYGYEGMETNIYQDESGIHILDRGPGITYEAFRIGASDKAPHERGFFGEGLKIASAQLIGSGCIVYAFNRKGEFFKVVSPDGVIVIVAMGKGKPPPPPYGTEIIIYNARLSPDLLENTVFQVWLKAHPEAIIFRRHYGSPERPNTIVYLPGVNVDTLWVRDIVVNKISNIVGKPSIFGYNLWWVNLEPNRVMVASLPELAKEAARAFTYDSTRILLDNIAVDKRAYIMIKRGIFETEYVDWYHSQDDARRAAADWVTERGLGVTTNEAALDWLCYMGVKPLLIPHFMAPLFSRAPSAETMVLESCVERTRTADRTKIPREALSLDELINLGVAEEIFTFIQSIQYFLAKKLPEINISEEIPDAAGFQKGEAIYISRSVLSSLEKTFGTIFHEYSHYKSGGAEDITVEFERAMTEISEYIPSVLLSEYTINTIKRILNGAWNARSRIWDSKTGTYLIRERLIEDIKKEVRFSAFINMEELTHIIEIFAPIYVVIFNADKIVTSGDIVYSHLSPLGIIPRNLPPDKTMYYRKVEEEIAKLQLERDPRKPIIIFIYDPWIDKYVVHRTLR
ncbi:MAG: hypothetical protein QXT26_06290 [Thermoproteota archaeon]